MKEKIDNLIKNLHKGYPPTEQAYTALLESIDFVIDSSFKEFIRNYDGAEGVINRENYIIFWNINDLLALNPYYEEVEECKKLFFFGTDGANLGYAFDKKSGFVICIDFFDITHEEPKIIAPSFEEFLKMT